MRPLSPLPDWVTLEHSVAKILTQQELHGWRFDERAAWELESYGYRLGEYKGEFGKTSDWSEWSQEMEDYCAQDVVVTTKLCDHFHRYLNGSN